MRMIAVVFPSDMEPLGVQAGEVRNVAGDEHTLEGGREAQLFVVSSSAPAGFAGGLQIDSARTQSRDERVRLRILVEIEIRQGHARWGSGDNCPARSSSSRSDAWISSGLASA